MLDEVEQRVVRPVQVLEDEHERVALGQASKKRRHAVNDSSRRVRTALGRRLEADERPQRPITHGASSLADRSRDRRASFSPTPPSSSPSLIAGLRLHHLGEGPQLTPSPYGSERPWRQ